MKHSRGIDFLIVSFNRLEYIYLAVTSIHKYVDSDYPYKVTIIDNSKDDLDDLSEELSEKIMLSATLILIQ